DGVDGDVVAEAFEAADVVAGLAGGVAAFVVVGAEVAVGGFGGVEQVPDDGEHGVAGGDERFFLGHAADQPFVPGGEEAVGPQRAHDGLADRGGQVGVAVAGGVAAFAAAG